MNYTNKALNLLNSTQNEVTFRENQSPFDDDQQDYDYLASADHSRNEDCITENNALRENILNTIKNCKMQKSQITSDKWITMKIRPETSDGSVTDDEDTSDSLVETSNNRRNGQSEQILIKEEVMDAENVSAVQVKVESISSWTDTDFLQPYFKDMNAVLCDNLDLKIDSSKSVGEATNIVKNGLDSDKFFECPHCSLVFNHPKRFLVHVKWHSFGQIVDKKMEVVKEKVSRHRQKKAKLDQKNNQKKAKKEDEDEGENLPCKDCDKTFRKKSDLKYHRYRTHSTHTHACKKCDTVITGYAAFRAHVAAHAASSDGYPCPDCPKSFKFHRSLVKHRGTHLEKTHECEECHRKFGTSALLKIHQRYHALQTAPFRCSYCGKGFMGSYHLESHEKIHKDEKPFHCDMCNSGFVRQYSLKKHMEVYHGQTKQHVCSVCPRTFQSAPLRNRHETRSHKKELTVRCEQCCRRLRSDEELQKHIQKEHCRIAQQA